MIQVILDTDILSYILDNRYPEVDAMATQYLRVFRYYTISSVTVCEIMEGFAADYNFAAAMAFQERTRSFEVLPFETEEAILAGQILGALSRTKQGIGDLDPLIAATAIVNDLPLVTNNQNHFQRIVNLGYSLTLDNWKLP